MTASANKNARRQPGADTTEIYEKNYTPFNREEVNTDSLTALSRRVWVLTYSLEEARQRYADHRQLLRQAGTCLLLALMRLLGVRI